MKEPVKISHTSALILQTMNAGFIYGFDVMEATGLPSGTVYPALRRLEKEKLIVGQEEDARKAARENRPARRYYKLTAAGKQVLAAALERYPLLSKLSPAEKNA